MCKVYTGHVQEIIMRGNPVMTLFLTVLIDNYDTNITRTQTQTH